MVRKIIEPKKNETECNKLRFKKKRALRKLYEMEKWGFTGYNVT